MAGPRRYRDVRTTAVDAPPDVVWRAVLDQVEVLGPARYVRLIGCRDTAAEGPRPLAAGSAVPGFRVVTADPPHQLVLDGVHRFSVYTLTFRLVPDGAGTRLEAHTDATFPGVLGALYRLLVIDSRFHKLATRSIVARVRRRVPAPGAAPSDGRTGRGTGAGDGRASSRAAAAGGPARRPVREPAVRPLCLVINGPSAAGKSTLTTAIQDRAEVPLLRFGLDELFRMVPDHWGGGLPGARHSGLGFRYENVDGHDGDDGVRRIRTGPDGLLMLRAMNAAIVAMLQAGQGVIVDGQAFEPEVNRDLDTRLRELGRRGAAAVAVVELRADDAALADRQRRHRHPVGLSLFHNSQPPQSPEPGLVLGTTGRDAEQVADLLWDWLVGFYPAIETGRTISPRD